MSKKLNSLSDLVKIKFDGLVPNQKETIDYEPDFFIPQHLEAHFSKKGRVGKVVTLIKGFEGDDEALKSLAKTLKQTVNTGGTVKNGEILIQGNYRDQIIDKLKEMGHKVKRIGG
jgi:translation initiation factor 1